MQHGSAWFMPVLRRGCVLGVVGFLTTIGASAYGQLTYSNVLPPNASFGSNSPSYSAPVTTTTVGTTTTVTATGTTSGTYPSGSGYSLTGSASTAQDIDPTAFTASMDLSASASALTPNGDGAACDANGGLSEVNFSVATTGVYNISSQVTYTGGSPPGSPVGGALFYTCDVAQINQSQGVIQDLVYNNNEEYGTAGVYAVESEDFTLVAGDLYGINFGATVNPDVAGQTTAFTQTLGADATLSIAPVAVPEPVSFSLVAVSVAMMGLRRRRFN